MTSSNPVQPDLQFDVLEHTASGRLGVKIGGELDLASMGEIEERLQKLAAEIDGALHMSCDLADLEFMDSSGLRLLLRWSVLAAERGGDFTISACSRTVRRAIEVAGIGDALALPAA
ncbi:MAG: hypothetical protein QOG62_71 [Thermoleophilaceae bacterium]|nr:hypothetical protein [Thermoleophilaceae bacterium]